MLRFKVFLLKLAEIVYIEILTTFEIIVIRCISLLLFSLPSREKKTEKKNEQESNGDK